MANIWSDSLSRSIVTDDRVEFSAAVKTAQWFEIYQRTAAPTAHTNYGQIYVKIADGKPYFQTSGGTELSMGMTGSNPLLFQGTIATAAQFPTLAAVQNGWVYRITADVIDNDGTKTNTGMSFVSGSEIAWTGSTWCDLGVTETYTLVNATPYAVIDAARCIGVDTNTIGVPSAINLPTAAGRQGKQIKVLDATADALAHNVFVNPNGAETINGVAAPFVLNLNSQVVVLVSDGTGWHTLGNEAYVVAANAHITATGRSHSEVANQAVYSDHAAVILTTGATQIDAALNGSAGLAFHPRRITVNLDTATVGPGVPPNGDAQITVGTTHGGVEILPATALTGLITAGQQFVILLAGLMPAIAGNATLHVTVSVADSAGAGGAVASATVRVEGHQA